MSLTIGVKLNKNLKTCSMAKLNEEFFKQLEFTVTNRADPDNTGIIEYKISSIYNAIYRQYTFVFHPDYHDEEEIPDLISQGKRIVAWAIDKAIKEKL